MQIAIVGLARSGKTTVFNTLTRGEAETGGYGGMTVNVGVVKVPDERLSRLTELFRPKREVAADVTYADLPAPPTSADGTTPAEIPADQLARLRNADALLHVVRAFDDPAVPWRPLVESFSIRRSTTARSARMNSRSNRSRSRWASTLPSGCGTAAERESNELELELLGRLAPPLREGRPIRDLELTGDEARRLRGFRFLTEKPVLVLLNLSESDIPHAADMATALAAAYDHRHSRVEALSARIEMEIGQLDADEAEVFRADLGLAESSLERVIRLSYELLGLISFFTVGPDETRAWTIPAGSTAVDAAAAIHTDLARGFIRAEVIGWQELLELGSMAEAKRKGRLRSEGRTYLVQDGDCVEVLHSS